MTTECVTAETEREREKIQDREVALECNRTYLFFYRTS